tara:strand:+ start:480 stop:662 length:183 start_codon:yes stop_codon:yes gene_type:complete
MKTKARISIVLDVDPEDFFMPVDGDPTDELIDMFTELLEHIDGATVKTLRIKCSGGTIDD